jgi:hypothetical protein
VRSCSQGCSPEQTRTTGFPVQLPRSPSQAPLVSVTMDLGVHTPWPSTTKPQPRSAPEARRKHDWRLGVVPEIVSGMSATSSPRASRSMAPRRVPPCSTLAPE